MATEYTAYPNPSIQLLRDKKLFVFDMDGTIYRGGDIFDYAIRFIHNLRKAGKRVLFCTNNSSTSTEVYVENLTRLGFAPTADEIMSSAEMMALIERTTGISREDACIFGDRLYTDIALGTRNGAASVLVLTGEGTLEEVAATPDADKPTFVFPSLDEVDRLMFGE